MKTLVLRAFVIGLVGCAVVNPALAMTGDVDELGLEKVGEGKFRWFGLPIYSAELWAESSTSKDRLFGSTLMLQMQYDLKISKKRIVDTTLDEWRRVGGAERDRHREWARMLLEILPDVRAGDRLSSLVVPGVETRFFLDGVGIGRIEDPDFGPAFLAIWLDRKTRAERLRKKLLARIGEAI